jgi:protein-disulfide isomerase/uncharacterized membrane protein
MQKRTGLLRQVQGAVAGVGAVGERVAFSGCQGRTAGLPRGLAALLALATLVAALAGLFFAAILGAGHVLDLPIPCGKSRGCMAVAMHPSSKLFGVPIAFFGAGAYLAILFLLAHASSVRWTRTALVAMAGLGTAISLALLIYSQRVIGATCWWCVGSGASMTSVFVLVVLLGRLGTAPVYRPAVIWGLAVLTAAAIGLQAGRMQVAALRPPVPASRLADLTVEEAVDQFKSLGRAEAPVTVVMFADLWCPACRGVFGSLLKYQLANPAGVRLVYRHLPLWGLRGHETSRAAAALAEIAAERGRFWPFVQAVHGHRRQLDRAGYLELMGRLGLEAGAIEARLDDPNDPAIARVLRDEAFAERLGVDATPTFLVLAAGRPAVSANSRTLAGVLNSPAVQAALLRTASE